jgi:aldoxime dehydratase
MESAIPQHLQRQRTRHRRISDDYNPPYPSIVARFDPTLTQVVMAYFGVQYTNKSGSNGGMKALKEIEGAFGSDSGPASWDRATYVDESGYANMLSVGSGVIPAISTSGSSAMVLPGPPAPERRTQGPLLK